MALSPGEKIKKLRKEKGLTQKELADALEVSISTIRMAEQDERQPSYKLLDSLAKFFNVNKNEIISDDMGDTVIVSKTKEHLTIKDIYNKQLEFALITIVKTYYTKHENIYNFEDMLEPLHEKLFRDEFIKQELYENGYDDTAIFELDKIPSEIITSAERKLSNAFQLFLQKTFYPKDFL